MRVRLTKPLGIHAKGSEHDVSENTGRRLISKGVAEDAKPKRIVRASTTRGIRATDADTSVDE